MPVRYTFSGNLFRVNLEDRYTLDEMMSTFKDALEDPLFPENARFLLDVRQSAVLEEQSYQDIRSVAHFFAEHSDRVGGCCAIVADKNVHYGPVAWEPRLPSSRAPESKSSKIYPKRYYG